MRRAQSYKVKPLQRTKSQVLLVLLSSTTSKICDFVEVLAFGWKLKHVASFVGFGDCVECAPEVSGGELFVDGFLPLADCVKDLVGGDDVG